MNETKLPSAWKLVPVEPTENMMVAFAETWFSKVRCIDDCEMEDCYADMLAAAPAPATWSSATAPGPDGMQHCIAVPGMPSAARDAAGGLSEEQAMALYHATEPKNRDPLSGVSHEWINAFARAVEAATRPTPAPVQQAAPSRYDGIAAFLGVDDAQPVGLSDERIAALEVKCDLLSASLKQADAENARLVALSEKSSLDAARWRGLLASARIRILGSAGIDNANMPDGQPYNNYAHFGMEIWTKYGASLDSTSALRMQVGNAQGRAVLIKYADIAILAAKEAP